MAGPWTLSVLGQLWKASRRKDVSDSQGPIQGEVTETHWQHARFEKFDYSLSRPAAVLISQVSAERSMLPSRLSVDLHFDLDTDLHVQEARGARLVLPSTTTESASALQL